MERGLFCDELYLRWAWLQIELCTMTSVPTILGFSRRFRRADTYRWGQIYLGYHDLRNLQPNSYRKIAAGLFSQYPYQIPNQLEVG